MRIIECYVESFGKLSKKKFDFSSGFNCINEENGSGKTTLATFIKVMLYGMSDTKKANLDENDRKHYLPWQGGNASGTLTFAVGDKSYRIERSFAAKAADDTFALYDLTLGKPSEDYSASLGEELFGIDADGFERTVFLSERALAPKSDNKSISAKLSDLVGCDGDIGDMDEALKALEAQRKFYYKKGGSGEIADTKAKITEVKSRLEVLDEVEKALAEEQRRLSSKKSEADSARIATSNLAREHEAAAKRVAKADYEKHCKEIKASLDESLKRRDELLAFFGGTPPSFEEIDNASYKNIEARSILESSVNAGRNKELRELSEYFGGKTTSEEIKGAKTALELLKAHGKLQETSEYNKIRSTFKYRIPEEAEVDEILKKQKGGSPLAMFCVLGVLIAVLGALLGVFVHTALLLLIVAAPIFIIMGIVLSGAVKRSKKQSLDNFFTSLSDEVSHDEKKAKEELLEIRNMIADAKAMIANERIVGDAVRILDALEAKFASPGGAVTILAKYEKYAELLLEEKYHNGNNSERLLRAKRLSSEAEAFASKFKTSSDDPLGEIRRALTEYNAISAEILSKRNDIERFASMHTLGEDAESKAQMSLDEVNERRRALEERSAEIAREIALIERSCLNYESELEMRDELLMKRAELEETLKKYEENYSTILLTKKYLMTARDNMTAKYLGKTKSSFEEYTKTISGITGEEFLMDTDFGVSKMDSGATRPIDAYSRGTRDLYNIAARLALVDSLYEGEKPFVVLDDPFCSFDDKKSKSALTLLKKFAKDRQIIYFTCSKSREA